MPLSADTTDNPSNKPETPLKKVWIWFRKKTPQFTRWFLFVVAVAVASFAIASLWQWLKGEPVDFTELISGGEGFLVTIAITADAIGRAAESKTLESLRAATCGVVLVVALIGFVFTVSSKLDQREKIDADIQSIKAEQPRLDASILAKMPSDAHLKEDAKIIGQLNKLIAQEDSKPYAPDRIAKMSIWLAVFGLISSFFVILLQEEQNG
jgi:hypothetical protein